MTYDGPQTLSSAMRGAPKTDKNGRHLTVIQRLVGKYGIDNGSKIYRHFGVKQKKAESYVRELFLALSEDSIVKNKLSLKALVLQSQTPGGTNEYVLKKLRKKNFYKVQQKVLNSVFKKF